MSATDSHRLRGTGGDLVFLDELAFFDQDSLYEAILPLASVDRTALIGVSTIEVKDDENFFTDLVRNHKRLKIKCFEVSTACPACIRAERPQLCDHKVDQLPAWSSKEKRDQLMALYGEARRAQYLKENAGLNIEPSMCCFPGAKVRDLFGNPPCRLPTTPVEHVFVAIDPCSGSNQRKTRGSNYALVSIIKPGCTIVGAEALDVTDYFASRYQERIVAHVRQLCERFPIARIIVAIENLTGLEHAHVSKLLLETFPQRVVCMQEKDLKLGVGTTHKVKEDMQIILNRFFVAGDVCLAEPFITTHEDRATMFTEWCSELCRYKEIRELPANEFGKTRIGWSGKEGGQRDDMAVALQLAVYWREIFWQETASYSQFY